MRTSLSKKLLAGLLSLVMVLSLVAPSMGTQAASKYSLTDKKSVKSDVTFKYQLKGVSKNQYVKVTRNVSGETVKYNKKAVSKTTKINGTGKTLNLYVTYGDKVANYTGKFTVKIYNKKTNKVVKTIVEKTTVKVKKLEVLSVETASDSGKYLVATFNKKLDTLKVADITIREEATGIMKGVESVTLASDGKSATIALVGSEALTSNSFVQPNTDYTFTVTQKGVSASTTFTVDAVKTNAVVTDVNATKRTITVNNAVTFVVPEATAIDFEEALGRTISVWYDKTMTVKKYTYADETVIISAFTTSNTAAGKFLVDYATGKKYALQTSQVLDGTKVVIDTTKIIRKTSTGNVYANYSTDTEATHNAFHYYAKITLNAYGNVKTIVSTNGAAWNGQILVDKVNGNVISAGVKTEQNLKDYTILKDGKTATVADIQVGDVVFYNTTVKLAEIYTDKQTSALTAVYDGKFTFAGSTLDWSRTSDGFTSLYVEAGEGQKNVDFDYMKALKASGKDITVYFDRTGDAMFITGDLGTVATSTIDLVLTKDAQAYFNGLNSVVRLTGFNGEKNAQYDIDLANVKSITDIAGTTTKVVGKNGVKFFDLKADRSEIQYNDTTTHTMETVASIDAKRLIKLKVDTNGVVVGIDFTGKVGTYTAGSSTKTHFTSGCTIVNGLQITKNTPVYYFNASTAPTVIVTKVAYGDFTGTVATDAKVEVYKKATSNDVYAIVVLPDGLGSDADGSVTKKAVVASYKTYDSKIVELTVVNGKDKTTYTDFAPDYNDSVTGGLTSVATGTIIDLTIAKDGKTVLAAGDNAETPTAGTMTDIVTGTNTFKLNGTARVLADAVVPTIVKVNAYGTDVDVVEFNELVDLATKYQITVSLAKGATDRVDTIVVTNTTLVSIAANADITTEVAAAKLALAKTKTENGVVAHAYTPANGCDVSIGTPVVKKAGAFTVATWTVNANGQTDGEVLAEYTVTVSKAGGTTQTFTMQIKAKDDANNYEVVVKP